LGDLRRQPSFVVESALAGDKEGQKAVNVKKFLTIHTLRSLPGQGAMFAMFSLDWVRNVNLYKVQTIKFSALYLRLLGMKELICTIKK